MRKLLIVTAFLGICLTLMAGFSRMLGRNQPLGDTQLFHVENCSQPCWNGIQPYRTSLDQAEAILRGQTQLVDNIERNDPSEGCALVWRSNSRPTVEGCIIARNGIVTSIELTGADNRNPIPLSAALTELGIPQRYLACNTLGALSGLMIMDGDVQIYLLPSDVRGLNLGTLTAENRRSAVVVNAIYGRVTASRIPMWRGFIYPSTYYSQNCD